MLAAPGGIAQVLCDAFEATAGELEVRLMAALRAAVAAGGEAGPVRSAGLSVVSGHGWRDTDLRVDWHDHPIEQLEELLEVWLPQRQDYVVRGWIPPLPLVMGGCRR